MDKALRFETLRRFVHSGATATHFWCLSVVLSTGLLSACSFGPAAVTAPGDFQGGGDYPVFVVNHGWHTGIIVPAQSIRPALLELTAHFPGADSLEFGWGDKDFYQADQVSWGLAVKAALLPTATVVRVRSLPERMQSYLEATGAVKLCLDPAELATLVAFVQGSFSRESGEIASLGDSLRDGSRFYDGSGRYHLFNTCNSWTARALKSLGMDSHPFWKLRAESVMDYLYQNSAATRVSATGMVCP
ncbi:DUF2459 domain-containing protein [Gilvimarinus sp. F26214L]|uniref:DUF2459 domain-containing protein n=1 Tax=Gilvimarinus sp. DZF01 TaxID=3461371 RepID=UPI0040467B2D